MKNKRCPLAEECGRSCHFDGRELQCDYYYNNARDNMVLEDQEMIRKLKEKQKEDEQYEQELQAAMEAGETEDDVDVTPHRDIHVVTEEVKELTNQAQRVACAYAIEIGRRLVEAKRLLPHGEWGKWLKEEVNFSQSTANNFVRLFEEYGSDQFTIFGAVANSQTIGNLPYSKALQLLAIPAEERESFAEKVDAENISVKQLQAAIKAKEEAEARARESERREAEAKAAAEEIAEKATMAEIFKKDYERAQKALEEARQEIAEAEKKAASSSSAKVTDKQLSDIRKEAEKNAHRDAEKKFADKIAAAEKKALEAQKKAEEAQAALREAEERAEKAQKEAKVSSAGLDEFKFVFDQMQNLADVALAKVAEIRKTDAAMADKLHSALSAFADKIRK